MISLSRTPVTLGVVECRKQIGCAQIADRFEPNNVLWHSTQYSHLVPCHSGNCKQVKRLLIGSLFNGAEGVERRGQGGSIPLPSRQVGLGERRELPSGAPLGRSPGPKRF